MDIVRYLVAFSVVFMIVAAAPKCPRACSREANPTCGFDGSCYRMFGSPCFMENFNCGSRSRFQAAPHEMCANPQLRCA